MVTAGSSLTDFLGGCQSGFGFRFDKGGSWGSVGLGGDSVAVAF